MNAAPLASAQPEQPYPGLRPFEGREWTIFFGRERMIDEVIERLARDRLVVIHGASGSGKSSLVRAGVMPKLARQHLRYGAPWLTCALRPFGGPLWNLATEFAKLEGRADDLARIQTIHALFNRRDATLAAVVGALEGLTGKSLCVLVDQFEELFRYEKETSREAAELFVDLIGRAATAEPETADVHVIVTMRSEFLGECARFDGFAETINRTQYLVPRMDETLQVGEPAAAKPAEPIRRSSLAPLAFGFAALAILVAASAGYLLGANRPATIATNAPAPAAAAHLSIVVLPFKNLSGDPSQDYFADGITENLTTDLSRVRDSFVIANSTANTYKGKAIDAKEIGKVLGVRFVLEGLT